MVIFSKPCDLNIVTASCLYRRVRNGNGCVPTAYSPRTFYYTTTPTIVKNIVMNAVKAGFPPEAGPPSAEKSASILPNELKLILHNFRKELVNEGNTKEPKT